MHIVRTNPTGAPVEVIKKLRMMADGIWTLSRAERVEFMALAYRHHLVRSITTYELWKAGWEGLGEREWDRCVELGDGDLVIAELMQRARNEGFSRCDRGADEP
jgi:hypothetical protein